MATTITLGDPHYAEKPAAVLTGMEIILKKTGTIGELQTWFSGHYPFLKLEFYKRTADLTNRKTSKIQNAPVTLQEIGLLKEGSLKISDSLPVGTLQKLLLEEFGLRVEVFRNSGEGLWLETTMTADWSLSKQNEYGNEIMQLSRKKAI